MHICVLFLNVKYTARRIRLLYKMCVYTKSIYLCPSFSVCVHIKNSSRFIHFFLCCCVVNLFAKWFHVEVVGCCCLFVVLLNMSYLFFSLHKENSNTRAHTIILGLVSRYDQIFHSNCKNVHEQILRSRGEKIEVKRESSTRQKYTVYHVPCLEIVNNISLEWWLMQPIHWMEVDVESIFSEIFI